MNLETKKPESLKIPDTTIFEVRCQVSSSIGTGYTEIFWTGRAKNVEDALQKALVERQEEVRH